VPIEDELKRQLSDVRDERDRQPRAARRARRAEAVAAADPGGDERPEPGPRAKRVKCAKISGDTSGNYHPHGESVIYPTLVRMAQEWNMRTC
jgi:hypothetical protein